MDNIDLDGTMTLTLTIKMEWRDPRLVFLNIRDNGLSDGNENIKDISVRKSFSSSLVPFLTDLLRQWQIERCCSVSRTSCGCLSPRSSTPTP